MTPVGRTSSGEVIWSFGSGFVERDWRTHQHIDRVQKARVERAQALPPGQRPHAAQGDLRLSRCGPLEEVRVVGFYPWIGPCQHRACQIRGSEGYSTATSATSTTSDVLTAPRAAAPPRAPADAGVPKGGETPAPGAEPAVAPFGGGPPHPPPSRPSAPLASSG